MFATQQDTRLQLIFGHSGDSDTWPHVLLQCLIFMFTDLQLYCSNKPLLLTVFMFIIPVVFVCTNKGKAGLSKHNCRRGKAVPLQAWSGPEGSRKLRFPDFVTTAQDGGKVVSLTHRPPLPPGLTWYSFFLEAESTPGHTELSDATEKNPGDSGNRDRDLPTCSAVP
jgi:hypothetical protein